MNGTFRFGVDYYPEHWPEERWEIDAGLMREAGFNVVRLAEFAWSRLEPREGEVSFGWLDRAIDILHRNGMDVVLGTPTGSPPPWVMRKYPDAYRVLADGRRLTFGHRRHYCPNHDGFRALSASIVEAMARHYAGHKAVMAWQIDNEFGDRCYCPNCQAAFGRWLERRHGSLAAVNERWGTVFWSQEYDSWDEIPLPAQIARMPNPGLALDYARFASDSYVDYQQLQIDILRRLCPGQAITHNLMGFKYEQIDYFNLARSLDFVAWDNYPRLAWTMEEMVDPVRQALAADTMRGLKRQNVWVMEEQSGPGGWEDVSVMPRPGEVRLWAWQAIAHGADGIVFFRWRTARIGTEQYWHGLLDHDAVPRRRYDEVKRMGAEIARVGAELMGTTVQARVALILSYDSRFAFQIQSNNPGFSYPGHLTEFYRAFHRLGVDVDIVEPGSDLSPYAIVLAPALHVLPDDVAAGLRDFVERGGVLAASMRTGVKGVHNEVVEAAPPGLLADLFGVLVEDYELSSARHGKPVAGLAAGRERRDPGLGAALVRRADPARRAADRVVHPGVLRRPPGRDDAWRGQGAGGLCRHGCRRRPARTTRPASAPHRRHRGPASAGRRRRGCRRKGGGRTLTFVLNHAAQAGSVSLDGRYTDMLSGRAVSGATDLAPYEVLMLRADP